MVDSRAFLRSLSEAIGVSGYEANVARLVATEFGKYADEVTTDRLGSIVALARGSGMEPRRRIMLAGHVDEIGLLVTKIEGEFLRFGQIGGVDVRVLPGQEVIVLGRRQLQGVIASRPPHVLSPAERSKVTPQDKLFVDCGQTADELKEAVRVGDMIVVAREFTELQGDYVAGRAFDDRTAVVVINECLKHLRSLRHAWDVYGVATVQEEVGLIGAMTGAYALRPDLAVAIDVTHGSMLEGEPRTLPLGKGPTIVIGPNAHPKFGAFLKKAAAELEIPFQIEPAPGPTGTDGWALQVAREGVPTAIVGIPLRYMHTSVETANIKDIERAGRWLAEAIARLSDTTLQEFAFDTPSAKEAK